MAGWRRSIATVCLSGTLDDKLAAAEFAGFDGVEIFENDLIVSSLSPSGVRQRCADLGLSIDLYQPFRDFEAVPADVLAGNLRRAERKLALMEQLGADLLLVCSSVSPDAIDDDELAAEQLHLLASRAAERGIRIAYEALAWGRFVNTWAHSWELVRRADHPALGLCLDSFHILSRESIADRVAQIPGELIFFLQLADAPRLAMDVLPWSRHHRLFPGQGSFDLPRFLAAVQASGYRGPLSLEVFNDVFRQADPARAAVDAMRSLVALESGLPAADVRGFSYADIAVDAASAPRVENALRALGFRGEGEWVQGRARIRLTARTGAAGLAEVTGFGVQSGDPPAAAKRARALLADSAAPDGTAVAFHPARDERGGLRIDHVALAQPYDRFDEAVLFHRSVLELTPDAETEYAAPFGLIRSRALADADRRTRIVLHGPVLRRGDWTPAVPDPQHIAFLTTDIFATAQAAYDRGAPLLEVSANYYDDLAARFELPESLLHKLRAYGILYDRDAAGGEFLHFCTDLLGSRMFFEVVQRVGGYDGYGTANAPTLMAAHRRSRHHLHRM